MEKRSPMGGSTPRHRIVFARDDRNGISDRYRFNERGSDRRVPQPDRHSGYRRSRDSVHGTRHGYSTASAGLPNWYPYAAIIATIAAAIAILIITGTL